jgi:hypothetical protein
VPVVDWSGVKPPEIVPEGATVATLTGKKYVESSKSSGKPYIELEFTVSASPDEGFNGRKLRRIYSLSEDALWALKEAMLALDADPDIFDGSFEVEEEVSNLFGRQAMLEVYHEDYTDPKTGNTRTNARVQTVKSMDLFN